jgi:UDP-hydrolysing UDP-N-acetyl-D-glucosamine 2-epimerase
MSHCHFVAAEPFRRRVIQMGEAPEQVMNYGAPGLDYLRTVKLYDRRAFEKKIDFTLGTETTFLVTYHPVTLDKFGPAGPLGEVFQALDRFPAAKIIFTKANADTAGRVINRLIDDYAAARPERAKAFTSLGQRLYLSAVKHADAVIGNSSSGLMEVPVFKKPTVNIGDRQRGRLRASSVIDCGEREEEIAAAIGKALSRPFRESLKKVVSPYGEGNASAKIKSFLKQVSLDDVLMKHFHDLPGVS